MPRYARKVVDEGIYHVLNRGNGRMRIFHKAGDFGAFIKLLEEGRRRVGVRIFGYCLMDNHWHLVVWVRRGQDLSRFVGWVCSTHVRRWREHRGSGGEGHLYQGRYKSFLVQRDAHFLTLMRYVESNPLRARMVKRAEDWRWSSIGADGGGDRGGSGGEKSRNVPLNSAEASAEGGVRLELAEWPVERPRNWLEILNEPMREEEVERVRVSLKRGRPFGGEKWVKRVVGRLGLEWTVRDPWRPKGSRKKLQGGRGG
jgi:putative transposase